jgi:copper chaperone
MSNTKETILSVDGMTCPSCISHVEGALCDLEGIGKVEVKLQEARSASSTTPPARTSGR